MKSNNTKINRKNGIEYLTYPIFDELKFIMHCSSTRAGGVSPGTVGAMNFGAASRDSAENILENYKLFCSATGLDIESIVISSQFHNANIKVCSASDRGAGVLRPLPYSDIDGLVTDEKNVTLCVFSADCIPVLFADPVANAVGACHCGWKGTYKNLCGLMIEKLSEEYNSKPENIKAVIAPGIKKCCYEVSGELFYNFTDKFPLINNIRCAEEKEGRFYLDLPEINRTILLSNGLSEKNIFVSDLCTCCNSESLHSHRATNGQRGIMGHFIGIK